MKIQTSSLHPHVVLFLLKFCCIMYNCVKFLPGIKNDNIMYLYHKNLKLLFKCKICSFGKNSNIYRKRNYKS